MPTAFERILKETPLEIRLKVALQMEDYKNWECGVYHGNQERLVPEILEEVEKWIKDKADLRYERNGDTPL